MIGFIALVIMRLLELRLDNGFSVSEIIDSLKTSPVRIWKKTYVFLNAGRHFFRLSSYIFYIYVRR